MPNGRPKIALALSGASGRAIAHIGVLEVLREHNIPIDYITACSSGAIVAGSFACGTMEQLKQDWFKMDRKFLLNLFTFDKSGRGVFSIEKAVEWGRKYVGNKKLEEVVPRLGFACVDVVTGQPLLLSLGDMVRAVQASCAIPGLFEPIQWGNKFLVDGGLFNLVPCEQAREMGADIVIGVDIAATRYMYKKRYIHFWRGYSFLKNSFVFRLLSWPFSLFGRIYDSSIKFIFYNQSDFFEEELMDKNPYLFSILGKAMEIASERHRKGEIPICDIMLSPGVKHLGKINFDKSRWIYEEGRRVALEAIPEIKKLIKDYQWRKKAEIKLKEREYAR